MKTKPKWLQKISVENSILFLMCSAFIFCFTLVGISSYQMIKDIYFYAALCAFLVIVLTIRHAKLLSIPKVAVSVIALAVILGYQVIHRGDWGYQYRDMLIAKHTSWLLFALILWDMVEKVKTVKISLKSRVLAILFVLAFALALILDWNYAFVVVIPALAWFLTPMDKEAWLKFINILAGASYAVYVLLMTYSLVKSPDTYLSGRYIGIFVFPAIAGVIASLALISAFYLWLGIRKNIANKFMRIMALLLLVAYPALGFILFFNRTAVISMFVLILFMYATSAKTDRKKHATKRGIIVLIVVVVLVIGDVVAIKTLQKADLSKVQEYVRENNAKPGMYLINRIVGTVTIKVSRTGVFEGGTLINALDTMSSTRISIWYLGARNVKFWGGSELSVMLPNGDFAGHVHNTYLDWMLRTGLVGGLLLIAWYVTYLVAAVKRHLANDDTTLFPFMWAAFCIAFFFMERELWINLPAFLLLILQHPFIVKFSDEMRNEDE